MSNKYGRNFTGFQNIQLKGSSTSAPTNSGMIEMAPGLTQAASTVSVSMIGSGTVGSGNSGNEHPYFHISNAGLSIGTGFIRMNAFGANKNTTLSISSLYDSDYAIRFPAQSGLLGVVGTLSVDMPAIGAGAFGETSVTISGLRADGVLVATLQDTFNTVTTDRGSAALIGAAPANGKAHLTFFNFGSSATIPNTLIVAYATGR